MASFNIENINSSIGSHNILVKRLDKKWINFPPVVLTKVYEKKLESYKTFAIREDDIFILGYPRSGTSRLQELVWIIANDCDFDTLMEYDADTRCINFE